MSRFFSQSDYQKIINIFNLGKIKKIEYFELGLAAPKVHVVTSKGQYVIAKYKIGKGENFKNKPLSSLKYEVDLLTSLKNLPTPKYIAYKKNNYILDFKGFAVTVYEYLKGMPPKYINDKRAFQLGKFLGSFHRQTKRLKNRYSNRYKFYYFSKSRYDYMRPYAYDQKNKELKAVVGAIETIMNMNRLSNNLPQGPIHVDIKADNELFKGDKLTGIVDFGNFYVGPFMLDLGKTIVFNCIKNNRINLQLMHHLLSGYEQERPLQKIEKKNLNKAIIFSICSHIWLDLYHVPLKIVPYTHTLGYVKNQWPAVRKFYNELINN